MVRSRSCSTSEAALAAATRRVVEEQAAEAERERAQKAEPIVKRLAERDSKLDDAMRIYVHFKGTQADIDALIALGVPTTTRALMLVNLNNAHESAMAALNRTARPLIALGRRRSFHELLTGWALPAQNWIKSKLNTDNAADAA